MTIKSRIERLEAKQPKAPLVFKVQIAEEVTEGMRQEQSEAHARGERYYIVEPESDGYYEQP